MSHLDQQLGQGSEPAGRRSLRAAADDEAEEAAGEAQVAAGVAVQLLWVPPNLSWDRRRRGDPRVVRNAGHMTRRGGRFTSECFVVTLEGGDKVPQQRQEDEAEASVAAQGSSQRRREGLRDAATRLRLLE